MISPVFFKNVFPDKKEEKPFMAPNGLIIARYERGLKSPLGDSLGHDDARKSAEFQLAVGEFR